jgi:hypothetical protein
MTTDYCYGEKSRSRFREELALPIDEMVPAADRLAVHISADVAESLIEHLSKRHDRPKGLQLGWDLHRTNDDDLGFSTFCLAMAYFEEVPQDRRWRPYDPARDGCLFEQDRSGKYVVPVTGGMVNDPQSWLSEKWATFARPRRPDDVLLIDVADEAVFHDWKAPPEIADALERLRNIADQRRAVRDAGRQEEYQTRIDRYSKVRDAEIAALQASVGRQLERPVIQGDAELRNLLVMVTQHPNIALDDPDIMGLIGDLVEHEREWNELEEAISLWAIGFGNSVLRKSQMDNSGEEGI